MLKCLGIKRVDFTNDEGEVVKGYNFWFADSTPSAGWFGCEVYKNFLTDEAVVNLGVKVDELPGHDVSVTYGRKNRIESLAVVK